VQPPLAPCPVCGAYSLTRPGYASTLLAVCDVLVFKVLETMGKYIVRAERSRYHALGARPYYLAHTIWQPDDPTVTKATKGAWDVVPALLSTHGCCDLTPVQVSVMLDRYVHDLVITGTAHSAAELAYRFESYLGLPVYLNDTGTDERPAELVARRG
jgi:hypothetical protein